MLCRRTANFPLRCTNSKGQSPGSELPAAAKASGRWARPVHLLSKGAAESHLLWAATWGWQQLLFSTQNIISTNCPRNAPPGNQLFRPRKFIGSGAKSQSEAATKSQSVPENSLTHQGMLGRFHFPTPTPQMLFGCGTPLHMHRVFSPPPLNKHRQVPQKMNSGKGTAGSHDVHFAHSLKRKRATEQKRKCRREAG